MAKRWKETRKKHTQRETNLIPSNSLSSSEGDPHSGGPAKGATSKFPTPFSLNLLMYILTTFLTVTGYGACDSRFWISWSTHDEIRERNCC